MTAQTLPARADAAQLPLASAGARRLFVVASGLLLLLGLSWMSLFVGSGDISAGTVSDTLSRWAAGDLPVGARNTTELLILERRLPRTVLAIVVGAALGLAGVLMQALTRNPLADPGLLGVNAGAYAAVVLGSAAMGVTIGLAHVWLAIAGALITAVAVYVIGTSGYSGSRSAKLILTGVAIGAVLSGLSYAVTLAMPTVFDRVRFWSAGSLQGRSWDELNAVLPFMILGALIAALLPRALNALSLGDDAAIALGARPGRTRVAGLAAVTLLCGAATAAAGPLSFIGLMVPHALRMLLGPDHRWLIPLSLLAAPALVLAADILARLVVDSELPAGVVTAFLGAPVLILLTRRRAVRAL
ncbi:FecCD family ABC transporter permease [Nesterenkonia alkaliphila]|uniref:Iron chelate uptake ABC transporter family permease subunit n=1 Tax=Nesterenkonia alkaliphila TaxID=1463631 RepID=A0A7K1UKK1_9MICC|nr:iron chelate uptake ABC transporter family permease subunit [Nesterenkonia alkaliphila]MVT26954.1 iron chelate uptake ABC transporter family permease subunit [Nesterenkonia alkaliphila]GFZ90397.1 iron ABC transporter permease [Nesterenkonia alkaliphila]